MSDSSYWKETSNLTWLILAIWFVFGYIIHYFVESLNSVNVIGFPLGFYMAAQGSLIVFVILIFWHSSTQDKIDRKHGVSEE